MSVKSANYNHTTKIITATFSNGTVATFDYGTYQLSNGAQKSAMIAAAKATIKDNGGYEPEKVNITIVDGTPVFTFINGVI